VRTNAFSSLFARLLQNASIMGELNSRAKRRGTFSGQIVRHKFVFASTPSQLVAHA